MNAKRVNLKRKLLAPAATRSDTAGKILAPQSDEESARNQLLTIEEIQIRAEEVTPLLRSILDAHHPAHWGNN